MTNDKTTYPLVLPLILLDIFLLIGWLWRNW